jgi:hypothetical protein
MRRRWCLGLLLLALSGCADSSDKIRTYAIGERVQTGPLVYDVFETRWSMTLGPQATPRVPAKHFVVVRVAITNAGATETTVPTMTLVDDKDQSTNELTDGTDVPEWLGIDRRLQPMQSSKGNVAFDAQPRHYRLRVSDETEQILAYIDLPLTFNSDERTP